MIELLYFIPILLSCFIIGRKIFSLFRLSCTYFEETIFSIILGFVFYSYFTLFLGLAGLLYSWIYAPVILLSIIIGHKKILLLAKNLYKSIHETRVGINLETFLKAAVGIFFILAALSALTPPFLWDEMDYRLSHPKIWARHHELTFIPSRIVSEFPSSIDMLYIMGFIFEGGILSKLFSLSMNLILAAALYSYGRRFFNRHIGLLACAIYLSLPLVMNHIGSGYVDIPVASIIFISFYCFSIWINDKNDRWIYLAALIAGYGAASKNTALVPAAVLALFVIFESLRRKKRADALKLILFFGLISFSMLAPWYAKTYARTGNPIWPFAYDIFGGRYWDESLAESFNQDLGILPKPTLINLITISWDITMHSSLFSALLGWNAIFLAFIPLLIFFRKIGKMTRYLLVYSIISFYLILILSYNFSGVLRYIMTYSFFSVLSAIVIFELTRSRYFKTLLFLLLAITFSFTGILWTGIYAQKMPYVFGLESEPAFYSKLNNANGYPVFDYINKNLPPDSKIFMFRDHRNYLSDRDYFIGSPLDQKVVDYSQIKNEEDFYSQLIKNGATHVFVNTKLGLFAPKDSLNNGSRTNSYLKEHQAMIDKMLQNHSALLIEDSGIYLYELRKS